jgi:hypothetical protein
MIREKGSQRAMLKLIESDHFLSSINELIKPYGEITVYDNWMPKSLNNDKEAELKNFLKYNFNSLLYDKVVNWWLHVDTTTPNWDLISTCTIDGKRGVLLVEAKAHEKELNEESHKKSLDKKEATENSIRNHIKIGASINDVNDEIKKEFPKISISRDNCYQLSNRVAHAWWLANQGIPVVLLYLGFLDCQDMNDGKYKLLNSSKEWEDCFLNHAKRVRVDSIIDKWVDCGVSKFIAICGSL